MGKEIGDPTHSRSGGNYQDSDDGMFRKTVCIRTREQPAKVRTTGNRGFQKHVSKTKMKLIDKYIFGHPEMQFTLKLKA